MATLTLRPNSDSVINLTRISGGSNYTLVDEETLNTADYVYTFPGSQEDVYGFPDHTTEIGTINSISIKSYCDYMLYSGPSGATNPRKRGLLKISSTNYYSGYSNLTTNNSAVLFTDTWTQNPATSSAWGSDWSVVDNLLAGIWLEVTTLDKTSKNGRCYQLWVEVDYTEGSGSGQPTIKRFGGVPFAALNRGVW